MIARWWRRLRRRPAAPEPDALTLVAELLAQRRPPDDPALDLPDDVDTLRIMLVTLAWLTTLYGGERAVTSTARLAELCRLQASWRLPTVERRP